MHADFTYYYKFTPVVIEILMRQRGGRIDGGYLTKSHFQMDYAETGLPNAGSYTEICNQLSIRYDVKNQRCFKKQTNKKMLVKKFQALQKMDM